MSLTSCHPPLLPLAAFLAPHERIPQAAGPAQRHADPRVDGQLPVVQDGELDGAARQAEEVEGQWAGGAGERERAREHREGRQAVARHQEPEPRHVQEVAVAQDVEQLARHEHQWGHHRDGQ